MTEVTFNGTLYTSQLSQFFTLFEDKPTFFCIQPELCILGTQHKRGAGTDVEGIKKWWHTYEANDLRLLKYDTYVDDEDKNPERALAKKVKDMGCDGWMAPQRKDQQSIYAADTSLLINNYYSDNFKVLTEDEDHEGNEMYYPEPEDAMYEIAVLPHAARKLTRINTIAEKDFFPIESDVSDLRKAILPLVHDIEDDTEASYAYNKIEILTLRYMRLRTLLDQIRKQPRTRNRVILFNSIAQKAKDTIDKLIELDPAYQREQDELQRFMGVEKRKKDAQGRDPKRRRAQLVLRF